LIGGLNKYRCTARARLSFTLRSSTSATTHSVETIKTAHFPSRCGPTARSGLSICAKGEVSRASRRDRDTAGLIDNQKRGDLRTALLLLVLGGRERRWR
jgi:hypothetical protein